LDLPFEEDQRSGYRIENDRHANWAIKKLARIRSRKAENVQTAKDIAEDAFLWCERENAKYQRDTDFLESILKNYHKEKLAEDDTRITITLPAGQLTAHKKKDHLEVDPHIFVPYAEKERPDLLNTTSTPKKAEIAKAFKATGELFPGVKRVIGEREHEIKENK